MLMTKRLGSVPIALTAAAACIALGGAPVPPAAAHPARVDMLKPITGASPFPQGCGSQGEFARDSEGENRVAVNPTDPRNLIVHHSQDRRTQGGVQLNVLRVTKDGGKTWERVIPPGVSRCVGGTADRQADPWVDFDTRGTAYIVENANHPRQVKPLPFLLDNGIAANRSVDGGLSWSAPTYLAPFPREGELRGNDNPAVTADPTRPGVAYAVWTQIGPPPTATGIGFSMTTDHGKTWSPERVIYNHQSASPFGQVVSVLPDGTLLVTFTHLPAESQLPQPPDDLRYPIRAIRSTDGGRTWSRAVDIATTADDDPSDPETGEEVRDIPWPRPTVTPDGTLHLVWYSVEGERSSPLFHSQSPDGGQSFTTPKPIVDGAWQHFGPSVAATNEGTLGLTYYDTRNDKPGDGEFTTDVWFRHSHDGGRTWGHEVHVAGSFDAATAPQTTNAGGFDGRFLGEYHGLAALPGGFAYAFTVAQPVAKIGPTDIFFARLRMGQAPQRPRLSLRVRPSTTTGGRIIRFRFRVLDRRRGVRGALVTFRGRRVRTNRGGHARMVVRLRRPGVYRATVTKPGFRRATSRVIVRRPAARRGRARPAADTCRSDKTFRCAAAGV